MSTYAYRVVHRSGWGTGFGPRPTHCATCGEPLPAPNPGSCTTGYGCGESERIAEHSDAPEMKPGEFLERSPAICYQCCAADDKRHMNETGRIMLYLDKARGSAIAGGYKVSNWPGSLSFPVSYVNVGRHNWARVRYDFRFSGPDGEPWRGTQYGDNTQIAHCTRVKK